MSQHFVCDRCGGPAMWGTFSGVPYVRLHSALPKDPLVIYEETFDLCRTCFELVQEFIAPNKSYGEEKK